VRGLDPPEPEAGQSSELTLTFELNGRAVRRSGGGHLTLLRWLRDLCGATEVKYACGEGICGACTVLVDGAPVSSCIVLAAQLDGASLTTAAGLGEADGALSPLQRAFHAHHAAQCGYCTPGMIVTAAAILSDGRRRSRQELREELHGNLCRCTGYGPILDAIEAAQEEAFLKGGDQ
jgi:aerobic-type carbon monoxide dehydrogenase small subunit (CoxS/CutS family)